MRSSMERLHLREQTRFRMLLLAFDLDADAKGNMLAAFNDGFWTAVTALHNAGLIVRSDTDGNNQQNDDRQADRTGK